MIGSYIISLLPPYTVYHLRDISYIPQYVVLCPLQDRHIMFIIANVGCVINNYPCVCVAVCKCVVCVCVCVCVCARMCVYMSAYLHVSVWCMCACVCVSVCILRYPQFCYHIFSLTFGRIAPYPPEPSMEGKNQLFRRTCYFPR